MPSARGTDSPDQTALIIVVPEVEALFGRFRARLDPSAAAGVPAHVTVLYPFLPPPRISAPVVRSLRQLFGRVAPFEARLARIRTFPKVLYLAPSPAAPFRRLIRSVFRTFPETPPYAGQYSDFVPHLTVAHVADSRRLAKVVSQFQAAAKGRLPVRINVRSVVLIERKSGTWRRRLVFRLGTASSRRAGKRPKGTRVTR